MASTTSSASIKVIRRVASKLSSASKAQKIETNECVIKPRSFSTYASVYRNPRCQFKFNSSKHDSIFSSRGFSSEQEAPTPVSTQEQPAQTQTAAPQTPPKVIRSIKDIIRLNFELNNHVKERNFEEAEKIFSQMLSKPELTPNKARKLETYRGTFRRNENKEYKI